MKTLLLLATGLLSAQAFAADTLTVYTYGSFAAEWGPGPKIKQAFEKECGCTLNLVPLEDGVAILNRLRLEGQHSKADLVLGLDDALVSEAKQSGLFAPHHTRLDALKVPGGWQDDTFVPYDYGFFAFVYDKDKLKQPPKSLKELVERQDLKVIYQDPRTSTPGQGLMLWMKSVYGDQAPAAWEQLAKKTVTVTKGWSEAYGMFLDGEAVDHVVHLVAAVALDPLERDLVASGEIQADQWLPQVLVLDRLFIGGFPAIALPACQPLRDAVAHVFGVRVEVDVTGFFEHVERLDGRHELHAIVRGAGLSPGEFLALRAVDQQGAPTARAIGVGLGAAVGVDRDFGARGLGVFAHGGRVVARGRGGDPRRKSGAPGDRGCRRAPGERGRLFRVRRLGGEPVGVGGGA